MIITTLKPDMVLTDHMKEEIEKQVIYWSDDRDLHWFFDFICDGMWISSWSINNELTKIVVDIFKDHLGRIKHGSENS